MEKGTIIIEPFMYEKLHLTLPEMAVYAIINGYSKNNKNCFVSLIEMSKMTKLNSVSICRILKRLTEKGYIKKTVISTRKVEYTVIPIEEIMAKEKPPEINQADKVSHISIDEGNARFEEMQKQLSKNETTKQQGL